MSNTYNKLYMQVMVNGLLTHYEKSGKGPVVVILHGWGDDGRGWAKVRSALTKAYTVIIPDLPGFGATEAPKSVWGLNEYAEFTQAFLTKINEPKLTAVLGHSNGGAIAVRGLATHKFKADKLVLLASAGIRSEYKGKKKALRLVAKAGKALMTPLPGAVKDRARRKLYKTVGSDMLVAEHLQDTFKKIVTDDVQANAAHVSVPTLLVYGENDIATPVRYGKKFEQLLPHATLKIIPEAGHFVHKDQFSMVMKEVEEFIQ